MFGAKLQWEIGQTSHGDPQVEGQAKTPVETCSALVRSVLAWLIGKQIDVEQPVFWCDVAATRWQAIATAQRL
jgi:hypothetical protein